MFYGYRIEIGKTGTPSNCRGNENIDPWPNNSYQFIMARRLPSLNAMRAFEAAARHLSFTRAADELNVTQAAISHQVKALEEELGVPLFRRLNRALLLTAGRTIPVPIDH